MRTIKTASAFFQHAHTRLTECKVFLHNDFRECFEIWEARTEGYVAFHLNYVCKLQVDKLILLKVLIEINKSYNMQLDIQSEHTYISNKWYILYELDISATNWPSSGLFNLSSNYTIYVVYSCGGGGGGGGGGRRSSLHYLVA